MEQTLLVVDRLKGPVVPLNLCFAEDDSLDLAAMRRYVNWLCEQHVPVVLLTYGSSEFASLTEGEIWRLTEEVAEEVAGRALFIASTGWWGPGPCREFLKHAERVGADAVKVQIHPWLGVKREVLVGYFDRIQDAAAIPLLMWGPWLDPYPVDVVAELAQRPEVVGIKNDGDPFYAYYDLIRATAGENFAVISGGQMRNFMFGYPLGSPAYLCPIAPFRPDLALRFYGRLTAGRSEEAWAFVFRYEEPWLRAAVALDWLPSIKSALHVYGLYPNHRLRPPALSHTAEQHQQVREMLEEVFGPIEPVGL
jgi:dihydrodipicolinate synthase/N-acetylneuraminate lyase